MPPLATDFNRAKMSLIMDLSDSDSSDPLSSSSPDDTGRKTTIPIVCHVKPTLWWLLALGVLEGAFMFGAPFFMATDKQNHSETFHQTPSGIGDILFVGCISWPIAFLIGWFVVTTAFELKRGKIRADEIGLSWRGGFGEWKMARWDEISDYYIGQFNTRGSKQALRVVETSAGRLDLHRSYEGIDAIADLVAAKATHIHNRGWEVKGIRPREEWSRTFSLWTNEEKWTAPCFTGGLVFLLLVALIANSFSPPEKPIVSRPSMGFWLDTFPLILAFAVLFPLVPLGIWACILMWRDRNFAWKHREEKLVLNAQGLTFTSPNQSILAKWDEVRAVNFLAPERGLQPVQISTDKGDFVLWKGNTSSVWFNVQTIFQEYVPDVMAPHSKAAQDLVDMKSDLVGERGAWSGGEVGMGARRWGFCMHGTRFIFFCASFVISILPLIYLQTVINAAPPDTETASTISWPHFALVCLLCALIITGGWLWYYRAAILADEDGLEVRSPFYPSRRAAWQNIEGMGKDAWGEFVHVGRKKLYYMRFIPPVRVEELRAYIVEKTSP